VPPVFRLDLGTGGYGTQQHQCSEEIFHERSNQNSQNRPLISYSPSPPSTAMICPVMK
jgi:hypothetical protein